MIDLHFVCVEFHLHERAYFQRSLHDFDLTSQNKNKIFWIHCDLSEEDIFRQLSEKLHLPDDVIQLCDQSDTMPKLIDTDDSLTIRIQCPLSTELKHREGIAFENLIIHLTDEYCLTLSSSPLPSLLSFTEAYPKALKYAKTPCFILFLVLDNVINDYSDILFDLDLLADQMDLHIKETHHNIYVEVMDIKNYVMKVKHHIAALRDILMRISGRKITVVSEQCRVSLNNLFNHSQMVVSEADAVRDILNSTLDKIDNALMQKMNETMKILTAFAAIFLPLTLIAGIYGMNFHWIPELTWKYGYFWALFLMILCGAVLLYVFKKMKWF